MQQTQIETEKPRASREGRRVPLGRAPQAQYLASEQTIGTWPGSLDEARRLVDAAIGRRVPDDERELLALLAERGARRAWHSNSRAVAVFE
jgi:hypothetical protein